MERFFSSALTVLKRIKSKDDWAMSWATSAKRSGFRGMIAIRRSLSLGSCFSFVNISIAIFSSPGPVPPITKSFSYERFSCRLRVSAPVTDPVVWAVSYFSELVTMTFSLSQPSLMNLLAYWSVCASVSASFENIQFVANLMILYRGKLRSLIRPFTTTTGMFFLFAIWTRFGQTSSSMSSIIAGEIFLMARFITGEKSNGK